MFYQKFFKNSPPTPIPTRVPRTHLLNPKRITSMGDETGGFRGFPFIFKELARFARFP